MKKNINNKILPVGLKGNQINERMKELMGITPINENRTNSVIELTKMGPDGNAYAIVRENHEYYIKVSPKKDKLVFEDFKYMGGLQNKKSEVYPSYAKAIKHLNLKFNSLKEAYNISEGEFNVFENDNLLNENGAGASAAGFQNMKSGFSGKGNLEKTSHVEELAKKNNPWVMCTSSVGREDKAKYEACVKDIKKQHGMSEDITEDMFITEQAINETGTGASVAGFSNMKNGFTGEGNLDHNNTRVEEVELTEAEKAVDDMTKGDTFAGYSNCCNAPMHGESDICPKCKEHAEVEKEKKKVTESKKLSIVRALEEMDTIIDTLSEGKVKKKVYSII